VAPWPVAQNIGPDLEFLASIGVSGHYADMTDDRGMDMSALKLYLIGRKGMDPSLNTTQLIVHFTDGFFGKPAGVHMRKYIDTLGASMLRYGAALPPSTDPIGKDANRGWAHSPVLGNLTFMLVADAMALAKRAAIGSGVAEHVDRVAGAMVTVQFIALVRWQELRNFNIHRQHQWPFAPTIEGEFDRFASQLQRMGVATISQGLHTKGRCGWHCNISQFRAQVIPL
jgi:hypothetical protein